jgi:hypothetical protein
MPSRRWNPSNRLMPSTIASLNTIHDQASPIVSTAPNTEQSGAAGRGFAPMAPRIAKLLA